MFPPDVDAVAPVVEELGRLSVGESSLDSLLAQVTTLAGQVLPGEPVVSVTIVGKGGPRTVAAGGDLALSLDELQYRLGDGPCVAAASTGRTAAVPDTGRPGEWPVFARGAAAEGCGSVLSFPLPPRERVSGALNVYTRAVTDERIRGLAERFAAAAVVPVSNAYLYEAALGRAGHLESALDSRGVIEQAKGILMERYRLTADQAFQALTRASMETNTKLRDVAEHLVATGELRPG